MVERIEHHRLEEMLSAYIDDELSPQERAEAESHLKTCADCAWQLRTLRQTVTMVKELPAVPLRRSFTIPEAQPLRLPQVYLYLRGATALVALLLILMVAGEVVWQVVSLGRPPTASTVVVVRDQEAPPSPTIGGEEALDVAPSPAGEGAQKGARDEIVAEPGVESTPLPAEKPEQTAVPTPGYEFEKEEAAPVLSAEAETQDEEAAPAQGPEEPPAATVEISPPMPAAVSRPAPSLTATTPSLPTPTATVLSSAPTPSPPTLTPTVVARVRSPTSPPEEAKTTETARPQPAGVWLTPWRGVELILLLLLIILIAMTVLVRHYRTTG